jgi:mono/diheme cytochrome c family protein
MRRDTIVNLLMRRWVVVGVALAVLTLVTTRGVGGQSQQPPPQPPQQPPQQQSPPASGMITPPSPVSQWGSRIAGGTAGFVAPPVGEPTDKLYTEDQATRGRTQFIRNCASCHVAGPFITREMLPPGVGYWTAGGRPGGVTDLGGQYLRKYPAVYHAFRRMRDSMPPGNPPAVSPQAKVEILAFLLKANGFPAGTNSLPLNVDVLKRMPLNEQGFDQVFNGKDLSGIRVVLGPNCLPAPLGCGTTEPGSTLWVDAINREIVSTGHPSGHWYPDKYYLSFDLRFETKFDRPVDLDPDDNYFDGNSGVIFLFRDHYVSPPHLEVQGNNNNMAAILGGQLDVEAQKRAQRPVGQWNSFRVVNFNNTVTSYLNGILVARRENHTYREPGYIGFQIEGAPIHWRNIRIKPL